MSHNKLTVPLESARDESLCATPWTVPFLETKVAIAQKLSLRNEFQTGTKSWNNLHPT